MAEFPAFFEETAGRLGIAPDAEFEPGAGAAPWVRSDDYSSEEHEVDLLPDVATVGTEWSEDDFWIDLWANELGHTQGAADVIAQYRPWHLYGTAWGIAINDHSLRCFTSAIARCAGHSPAVLAPWVLRQVLAHEFTHFAFEVAGTVLEDVLQAPLYADYVLRRYGCANRWTTGPLEEVAATWAEQDFAETARLPRLGRRPAGYARAVAQINGRSPAGYRDCGLMRDPRRAERIVADIASGIGDRPLWTGRWWPTTTATEHAQVPLLWRGTLPSAAAFGLLPKSLARPSVEQFEKWIEAAGGSCRRGGKHWKATLPNGRRCSYTKPADHF